MGERNMKPDQENRKDVLRTADGKERVGFKLGMGWLPDYPDFRDLTIKAEEAPQRLKRLGREETIREMLGQMKMADSIKVSDASFNKLLRHFSPVENQGPLGSCTANAGVGLVEYYERRAFGKHIDASRLFLYKATRNLLRWTGDTGAFIRTTMGAMVLFGVPPEEYWPYVIEDFDKEPSSFCYSYAKEYQTIQYFRLDPPGTLGKTLLDLVKGFITAGFPSMFGFTVFSSIRQARNDGKIPFPCLNERVLGGHAIIALGFNDEIEIENPICGAKTTGALLIRNSWGKRWGKEGYGWLPYKYVLGGLARDWWLLLRNEWVESGQFGI
jgi:C1A family cysteine protease